MNQAPKHIGIIPDGNRRWAKERGLPTLEGHRQGYEKAREIAEAAFEAGVAYMTFFGFSKENWDRSAVEVKYLMDLFYRLVSSQLQPVYEKGVRLRVIGRRDGLGKRLLGAIEKAEALTRDNQRGTLVLCLNYSGQQELADAAAALVREGVEAEAVTPERLAQQLYAPEIPPVDLVIRSSGEQRLSGFMLWRAAYAELVFVDKYWPDFGKSDLAAALDEFGRRKRRFGK